MFSSSEVARSLLALAAVAPRLEEEIDAGLVVSSSEITSSLLALVELDAVPPRSLEVDELPPWPSPNSLILPPRPSLELPRPSPNSLIPPPRPSLEVDELPPWPNLDLDAIDTLPSGMLLVDTAALY